MRRQPKEIRHPKRLAQRPGLGQRPIIIQHSRKLTQRPGRRQRPMIIRRSLEIGLEPAGQGRVPQWSIPGPSCTHSIPDSGLIRIQNADLTRTTLNSGVYINRSSQASSRITPIDLVETPSPDLASPHLLFSVDRAGPGAPYANSPGTARRHYTGPRSAHHTSATGVNSSLPLVRTRNRWMTWYKQEDVDDLV